jgi:hypothetical protein
LVPAGAFRAPARFHIMASLKSYPAEKARGAAIILHERWQRIIFIGGLAFCVVLLLIADLALH